MYPSSEQIDLTREERTKIEYITQFKHLRKVVRELVRTGEISQFFQTYLCKPINQNQLY